MTNAGNLDMAIRLITCLEVEEAALILGLRLDPVQMSQWYTRRNLVFWLMARRGISPEDRVAAITSLLAMPPRGVANSVNVHVSAARALMALDGNHELDQAAANHSLPEAHRVYLTMVMEKIIMIEMAR